MFVKSVQLHFSLSIIIWTFVGFGSVSKLSAQSASAEDFSAFWSGKPYYQELTLRNMMRNHKRTNLFGPEVPLEKQPIEYRAARAELIRRGLLQDDTKVDNAKTEPELVKEAPPQGETLDVNPKTEQELPKVDNVVVSSPLKSDEDPMLRDLGLVYDSHLQKFVRNQGYSLFSTDEAEHNLMEFESTMSLHSPFFKGSDTSLTEMTELKAAFEYAINRGQRVKYNRDSRTIFDPFCHGTANCESGTELFLRGSIASLGPSQVRERNMVVIHSRGHVQPGFIVWNDDLKDFELYRIETTSSSVQPDNLGRTANLVEHGPLRVLLAEDYLRMRASELNGTDSKQIIQNQLPDALARVAKFGVPTAQLEGLISREIAGKGSDHSSLMAFGQAEVPPGDRERSPTVSRINFSGESSGQDSVPIRPTLTEEPDLSQNEFARHLKRLEQRYQMSFTTSDGRLVQQEGLRMPEKRNILTQSPRTVERAVHINLERRKRILDHPEVKALVARDSSFVAHIDRFFDEELNVFVGGVASGNFDMREYRPWDFSGYGSAVDDSVHVLGIGRWRKDANADLEADAAALFRFLDVAPRSRLLGDQCHQ